MTSVYINDVVNSQLDTPIKEMVQSELSRILIIYTGGTIGMQNNPEHGYLPVQGYLTQKLAQNDRFHVGELSGQENLVYKSVENGPTMVNGTSCKVLMLPALTTPPSLFNKRIRYSILEYSPLLDSSNMTMSDWVQIATDIEINYELYDAFLILHGTDTMAYTASALSFMLENLGKSVIITGSQVPLAEVRTDALDNLLGALTIAGHFVIPEVGLFFDNKLFRGNRCSKVNAVEFNAFESPNFSPLVTVGINIDVSWEDVWRPKRIARFKSHKNLNPSVASLRLFPGITEATVRAFFSPQIYGVVLETYGSGNAPSNRPDILKIIKEACDAGVVVVNCSQCKKATVTSIYQTGVALLKIGVVPGADMTPECALTKLTYLLGKYKDPDRVRHLMCKNLRGELTMVSKKTRFTYLPFGSTQNAMVSSIMQVIGVTNPQLSAVQSTVFADLPDKSSLEVMEDHHDETGIASRLVPIAFCHAARIGDVATLYFLVQEFEHMVNLPSEDGMTPLHVAAIEGQFDAVKLLLKHGANVHLRNRYNRTPLLDSILFKHGTIALLLRQTGAHFSPGEESEVVASLCKASLSNDDTLIKLFLQCGANPNLFVQDGRTPLHLAVSKNNIDAVYALLGDSINISSLSKALPVIDSPGSSAESTFSDIVLRYELDLEPLDDWKKTPLMYAQEFGFVEVTALLTTAIRKSKINN